jgi:hypothetical protein
VAAAAEGAIDITPFGSDPEIVKCLLQQDGEVIGVLLVV